MADNLLYCFSFFADIECIHEYALKKGEVRKEQEKKRALLWLHSLFNMVETKKLVCSFLSCCFGKFQKTKLTPKKRRLFYWGNIIL